MNSKKLNVIDETMNALWSTVHRSCSESVWKHYGTVVLNPTHDRVRERVANLVRDHVWSVLLKS